MNTVHRTLLISASLSLSIAGCAKPPEPRYVRLADLASQGPLTLERPLVIEVQQGDKIPLHFKLEGPFLVSAPDAPVIPLVATRHFFLRIDKDGLRSSADGKSFDWTPAQPGSFRVGLGATRGSGPIADVVIRAPTPR